MYERGEGGGGERTLSPNFFGALSGISRSGPAYEGTSWALNAIIVGKERETKSLSVTFKGTTGRLSFKNFFVKFELIVKNASISHQLKFGDVSLPP